MSAFRRVESWEELPSLIAQMQLAGSPSVPLYQALYRGELAVLPMFRPGSAGAFKRWAAMIRLPGVALIGDDAETQPDGPEAWPVARRVLAWARFVLVHGGAGAPDHYSFAVDLARQYRRLVLVECSSFRIADWEAAASKWCQGAEGLVMQPPTGMQHPTPTAKAGMH